MNSLIRDNWFPNWLIGLREDRNDLWKFVEDKKPIRSQFKRTIMTPPQHIERKDKQVNLTIEILVKGIKTLCQYRTILQLKYTNPRGIHYCCYLFKQR